MWNILTIIAAIFVGLCSAIFWVFFVYAVESTNYAMLALYLISAIMLVIFCIFGLVGVWKKSRYLLLMFIIAMVMMMCFLIVQIIIYFINYHTCSIGQQYSYVFPCSFNVGVYLAPTIIALIIFFCAAVFATIHRKQLDDEIKGTGKGSYY